MHKVIKNIALIGFLVFLTRVSFAGGGVTTVDECTTNGGKILTNSQGNQSCLGGHYCGAQIEKPLHLDKDPLEPPTK